MDFQKIENSLVTFRDVTSNTPEGAEQQPSQILVMSSNSDKLMYSDAFLMILSNKNNPIVEVRFQNFSYSIKCIRFYTNSN